MEDNLGYRVGHCVRKKTRRKKTRQDKTRSQKSAKRDWVVECWPNPGWVWPPALENQTSTTNLPINNGH